MYDGIKVYLRSLFLPLRLLIYVRVKLKRSVLDTVNTSLAMGNYIM